MKRRYILLLITILVIASAITLMNEQGRAQHKSSESASNQWHFIALGDSRQPFGIWDAINDKYTHDNISNPTRAALITSIVQNNPNLEFILHTGDIVLSGGEQDDWNRYFEDIINASNLNVTFYYSVGNHERYTYALGDYIWGTPDVNFSTYLANVELPGNERFYSFDYMNQIHFIIINTEEDWTGSFDITTDQYNWLINDLSQNEIDLVIAAYHRPSYSIRDVNRVHDAQQVRSVLEPIFLEYGVDLVFSGHDHYYYRTKRNGITYVTTGGAGADLYTNNDNSDWQTGDVYFSDFHYCNITVTENAGNITLGIDVFLFNEANRTISLADTFIVRNIVPDETTTTDTTESEDSTTTSTTSSVSGTSISSDTTTSQRTTPFSLSLIMGVILTYYFKKRK